MVIRLTIVTNESIDPFCTISMEYESHGGKFKMYTLLRVVNETAK